jgi:hypothetical protein
MPGHRLLGDQAEALDGAQQRRQLGPAQGGTAQAEVPWGTGTAGAEHQVGVPCTWATIAGGAMPRLGGPGCPPVSNLKIFGPIPGRDLRSRLFGIAGW